MTLTTKLPMQLIVMTVGVIEHFNYNKLSYT